ncbi:MAG TPA: ABC transporter ATP-binding protein [Solirubrobacteraceae bacterium]|jgi:oligopeptide/dipeptide ABC transporter ATP-binding protein
MALVEVHDLRVELPIEGTARPVLRDVALTLDAGEALGLVGESGAGKSMTVRALAALLPPGASVSGRATIGGHDVIGGARSSLRQARTRTAVIFQDPRAHINPVYRIGDFLTEQLRILRGVDRRTAARRAMEQLDAVGIPDGERRLRQYPHELSGGLLQRVMIAAALLAEPELILADEPTTALDVTTQSEVMAILDELRRERGLALLFITHDLDLAAAVCDRTAVMYAGQIVELQASASLHGNPRHPYTAALAAARPPLSGPPAPLPAIEGRPIGAWETDGGCAFAARCVHRRPECDATAPLLRDWGSGEVRCLRAEELDGRLAGVAHG